MLDQTCYFKENIISDRIKLLKFFTNFISFKTLGEWTYICIPVIANLLLIYFNKICPDTLEPLFIYGWSFLIPK